MQKRKLRIVKEAGGVPPLGICERCNAQFAADPHLLGNAKDSIQSRFDAHKSKPVDSSQNALRIVREAT
ncbi:MAG TPA: hypothetical protein VN948_07355 [Terriglobales bacterium]|nr:hypothetical protein [Terriglobales bacterium]